MQKTYFKLGDPDFNSSNDEYKQFEIGSTNGANLAINMGGAVISNNATAQDPNPTTKKILINGEEIPDASDIPTDEHINGLIDAKLAEIDVLDNEEF